MLVKGGTDRIQQQNYPPTALFHVLSTHNVGKQGFIIISAFILPNIPKFKRLYRYNKRCQLPRIFASTNYSPMLSHSVMMTQFHCHFPHNWRRYQMGIRLHPNGNLQLSRFSDEHIFKVLYYKWIYCGACNTFTDLIITWKDVKFWVNSIFFYLIGKHR